MLVQACVNATPDEPEDSGSFGLVKNLDTDITVGTIPIIYGPRIPGRLFGRF